MNNYYYNLIHLCDDLFQIISEEFGDRFVGDWGKVNNGAVYGKIDGNEFFIRPLLTDAGKVSGIFVSALSKEESSVLTTLFPILKQFMNNANPICSYDLTVELKVKDNIISSITKILPTIEWSIDNPEKRLEDIFNGEALAHNEKVDNLVIFNENTLFEYLENGQELKRKKSKVL